MKEEMKKKWRVLRMVWLTAYKGQGGVPCLWDRVLARLGFSESDCDDIAAEFEKTSAVKKEIELEYREYEWPKIEEGLDEWISEEPADWRRERRHEYLQNAAMDAWQALVSVKERREAMDSSLIALVIDDVLQCGAKDIREAEKRYRKAMIAYARVNLDKVPDYGRNEEMREAVEIARAVPVESLIGTKTLNAGGGRKKALCPFHFEKTASFVIFKEGSWYCFGCTAHGRDAIDFVRKKKDCDFLEAVRLLVEGRRTYGQ